MTTYNWYSTLIKPIWSPPVWVFGPVWTMLYILIAISFGKVFLMAVQRELPLTAALPFALNLVFTYFQFTLQNNLLAAADILLCLITLIWAMIAIFPHKRWITLINIPYLAWVSFATVLQLTITYLNW